jgi:predicted DNA-binding protein (MmcQ/YjbR family)
MDIEAFRGFCLSKKGVTEEFPFDEHVLAFKVLGKIFALTNLNNEEFTVNLKCDPERAVELRDEFDDIQPGFHMNKKHWNTVFFEASIDDKMLMDLINHSYQCVCAKMTKKDKAVLAKL